MTTISPIANGWARRSATGCELHAYVQITDHVHLLLSPPESEAVSRLMISLGRRYVQYINKTYRRKGTKGQQGSNVSRARAVSRGNVERNSCCLKFEPGRFSFLYPFLPLFPSSGRRKIGAAVELSIRLSLFNMLTYQGKEVICAPPSFFSPGFCCWPHF